MKDLLKDDVLYITPACKAEKQKKLLRDFEAGEKATVIVNPYNCLVGCHSCQRICEFDAITFPTQESLIKILKDLRT